MKQACGLALLVALSMGTLVWGADYMLWSGVSLALAATALGGLAAAAVGALYAHLHADLARRSGWLLLMVGLVAIYALRPVELSREGALRRARRIGPDTLVAQARSLLVPGKRRVFYGTDGLPPALRALHPLQVVAENGTVRIQMYALLLADFNGYVVPPAGDAGPGTALAPGLFWSEPTGLLRHIL